MQRTTLLVIAVLICSTAAAQPDPANRLGGAVRASFGSFPLYFVENRGVHPDEVRFYIPGADKTLFFTDAGVTIALGSATRGWTVTLDFVAANRQARPRGVGKPGAVFSYFTGPEQQWKTALPAFSTIVYRDLWPGIDLVYKGTVNELKYAFVVAPGADPAQIRLRYRGVSRLAVTADGALTVSTPAGGFRDAPPAAYQEIGGRQVPVAMAYDLRRDPRDPASFGFRIGRFDDSRPLILDPVILVYCGFIGGSEEDQAEAIAVDDSGHAYVVGHTRSAPLTFPVKTGPYTVPVGGREAFVAKINPAGTGLVYCGYIGGSHNEYGKAIAVDAAGNAYVAGRAESSPTTFPVKIGPVLTHGGGFDGFVAKVNAAGTALLYCGYIGGDYTDECLGIALDATGAAYVTGITYSNSQTFPLQTGPALTHGGGTSDAFVAKISPSGSSLVYCGYIGGSSGDTGSAIAVDAAGCAHVAGSTGSAETTFPVRVGPGLVHQGVNDAFVAKVNPQGTGFVYCGYIGGWIEDRALGIALDGAGNAVVAGYSVSPSGFPVTVGPDLTYNGGMITGDVFVARVNASGRTLDYCGYIGGKEDEIATGVAVDAAGCAYVAGVTLSDASTFPVAVGPSLYFTPAPYPQVTSEAFVAKVHASGKSLTYCGYLGGRGNDTVNGIAVDRSGNAYLAGVTTSSSKFPVTVGPDLTYNGKYGAEDAFVAKVAVTLLEGSGTPSPGGAVKLALTASDCPRADYQVGSSFGTGPLPLGTRSIGLSLDALLSLSVSGATPGVFSGYRGMIDAGGSATANIHLPALPVLTGIDIHSAFITLDPKAQDGIKSISNTWSFRIGSFRTGSFRTAR